MLGTRQWTCLCRSLTPGEYTFTSFPFPGTFPPRSFPPLLTRLLSQSQMIPTSPYVGPARFVSIKHELHSQPLHNTVQSVIMHIVRTAKDLCTMRIRIINEHFGKKVTHKRPTLPRLEILCYLLCIMTNCTVCTQYCPYDSSGVPVEITWPKTILRGTHGSMKPFSA